MNCLARREKPPLPPILGSRSQWLDFMACVRIEGFVGWIRTYTCQVSPLNRMGWMQLALPPWRAPPPLPGLYECPQPVPLPGANDRVELFMG